MTIPGTPLPRVRQNIDDKAGLYDGMHLLISDLPTKGANLKRNVEESRQILIRCVADAR